MSGAPGTQLAIQLRQKPILLGIVLVFLVLVVYSPTANYGFLNWDDPQYISENPHVANGFSAQNIAWAFTSIDTFYWHPLTWLSHMLDCQLFGLNPGPHHLVNVLLHALNVLLLFLLLHKATGAVWRSLLVAALFAFHPLNVETVAWLAERKSLLSAFFCLLTIAVYGWYVRRPSLLRYGLVACLFLFALMSKPTAVTVPVLLLLLDYWPLHRIPQTWDRKSWIPALLDKLPLLAMSAGSSAVTIIGHRAAGALSDLKTVPLGMRLEQALVSIFIYLRKLFWPDDLSPFYPYHPHRLWTPQVVGSLLLLAVVTALTLYLRRMRFLVVGWLAFLVSLFPVLGFFQAGRAVVADRFMYIPAIGIFIALVWSAEGWVASGWLTRWPAVKPLVAAFSVMVVAALAITSTQYLPYWQSGLTLFTRAAAMEKTPDATIEDKLGDSLMSAGRVDEALIHFQRSCELEPYFDACNFNLAEILFARYDARAALEHYQTALEHTQDESLAIRCLINSGEAMLSLGDLNGAQLQLSHALRLDPGNQNARQLLERVNAGLGSPSTY